jgi:hypothetical protein
MNAGAATPAGKDEPAGDFLAVLADESREEMSRRKQDRSKRREQEILRASLRVFARDGISRARIGDPHSRSGIGDGPTIAVTFQDVGVSVKG